MAIPLLYLIIRGVGASGEAWDLLFRAKTLAIIWRSLTLMGTVTILSILIGVPLAWITARSDIPLRRFWSISTALPLVLPSYVGALVIVSALGPTGLAQDILNNLFDIQRLPEIYGLSGATLTLTLINYPLVLLTVRAAISGIDPALEESARSLGANQLTAMIRTTLPQLRPSIASGSLLVALYTLSDFGAVSLLRYETFTWAIYQQYQSSFDRTIAASLSLVLVTVAIIVLMVETWSKGQGRYYRVGPGTARSQTMVLLGDWKWPAIAFCSAVVTITIVGPAIVLIYWIQQGISSGENQLLPWLELWNSCKVAGLAALATTACSIPVATLAIKYPSKLSWMLERLTFTGYALPGIVVALSLVFIGINVAQPIYQTIWILLFAYIVLFLPIAMGTTSSTLLQISPRLEEAARGLGRTPIQTLFAVVIPQMRSGILTGIAMVFLVTIKELPVTLILGPLGFKTLATIIWSTSSEAFYAKAAVPALIIMIVSSVPMIFLAWKGERLRA